MFFAFATNVFQSIMVRTVVATAVLFDGTGPSGGIFAPILDQIQSLCRDLWGVLVGLVIIVATLAMIISVLRGAGGMLIGGSKETTVAVIGVVGVVLAGRDRVCGNSSVGKLDEKPYAGRAFLELR